MPREKQKSIDVKVFNRETSRKNDAEPKMKFWCFVFEAPSLPFLPQKNRNERKRTAAEKANDDSIIRNILVERDEHLARRDFETEEMHLSRKFFRNFLNACILCADKIRRVRVCYVNLT